MEHTPFMKIKDAARVTGLSMYYLRNGCKDGSVPHVKSGTVYLINMPRLLEKLDALDTTLLDGKSGGEGNA